LPIDPVVTAMGLTGRSVLECPTGRCIILHYPPADLEPPDLSQVLDSDPNSTEDNGEVYFELASPWCAPAVTDAALSTFNCCTYAVGDIVGLTPGDWINPVPDGNTDNSNPMQILLDSYFRRVKVYQDPTADWEGIERDQDLRRDDVLCYVQTGEESVQFVHVGKVYPLNGKNWLLSKFGCGPIVRAPISASGNHFSGHWTKVWVYRIKVDAL
jgi:hypothetical protein